MDFAHTTTLVIGPRPDPLVASWPVSTHTDNAITPLESVASYAQAEECMSRLGADRLFAAPEVLGDMVRAGAGPGEPAAAR